MARGVCLATVVWDAAALCTVPWAPPRPPRRALVCGSVVVVSSGDEWRVVRCVAVAVVVSKSNVCVTSNSNQKQQETRNRNAGE